MGKISIDKIEIFGNIGAFAFEKKVRQKFLISVSFEIDFIPAARKDDLNKTIDYSEIVKICHETANKNYSLIESLVVDIAERIQGKFPMATNIMAKVEKPEVQLGSKLQGVSVSHVIP